MCHQLDILVTVNLSEHCFRRFFLCDCFFSEQYERSNSIMSKETAILRHLLRVEMRVEGPRFFFRIDRPVCGGHCKFNSRIRQKTSWATNFETSILPTNLSIKLLETSTDSLASAFESCLFSLNPQNIFNKTISQNTVRHWSLESCNEPGPIRCEEEISYVLAALRNSVVSKHL